MTRPLAYLGWAVGVAAWTLALVAVLRGWPSWALATFAVAGWLSPPRPNSPAARRLERR